MVNFKAGIWETGNSFVVTIPKKLINKGIVIKGICYSFTINKKKDKK